MNEKRRKMVTEQVQDVTFVIADLNNRVRTVETKYNLLGERVLIVNKNMIEEYKKVITEIKIMNEELREIRRETAEMKDVIRNVVAELNGFAKKDAVKSLEKYVKLLSPLNFVTEEELKRVVDELKNAKRVAN